MIHVMMGIIVFVLESLARVSFKREGEGGDCPPWLFCTPLGSHREVIYLFMVNWLH